MCRFGVHCCKGAKTKSHVKKLESLVGEEKRGTKCEEKAEVLLSTKQRECSNGTCSWYHGGTMRTEIIHNFSGTSVAVIESGPHE